MSVNRVRSGAELTFGWHSRRHGALTRATSVLYGVTARSVWRALRVKTLEMAACLGLVGVVSVPCRVFYTSCLRTDPGSVESEILPTLLNQLCMSRIFRVVAVCATDVWRTWGRAMGVVLRRSARKSQISVIAQPVIAPHLREDLSKSRVAV